MAGSRNDRRPRYTRGDLLEQLKPFAAKAVFEQDEASGVAARPRQTVDHAGADRIDEAREHDRDAAGRLQQRRRRRRATGQDNVRRKRDQFRRILANVLSIAPAPADLDPHVAAVGPSQLRQTLQKRREAGLCVPIVGVRVRGRANKHADAAHPLRLLLCTCRERPRGRRAAEQRDELAALHSMPPGCASEATMPLPTGSPAPANTMEIVAVACFAAPTAPPTVTMTSTLSRTNSAAIPA